MTFKKADTKAQHSGISGYKENIIKVFREREKGQGTILNLMLTYSSQ